MAYGWQILLNSVDISDKVSGFSISCSLDSYCREMTLDIADASLYASLDFSQISESPEIEILTKNGTAFISQGTFYIEKPAVIDATHSELMTGVWGRSLTAMLGEPFAPKVSKAWTERTTFLGIVEEMCDLVGFTWNAAYCEIDDFVIYANTYECDGVYPIDVITELAELAGARVTTDRSGHLCIKQIDYAPTAVDFTITDDDIAEITESPEWPEFGNRISITPTGSTAGYAVDLTVADECLSADSASRTKLYAQVMDEDDEPVNGVIVAWTKNTGADALLDYATSNTKTTIIQNEEQSADNFYSVTVDFEPSLVVGIWAASDTGKKTNLAAAGYTLDGNTITLTTKLGYCNQSLVITYESDGIAINYLTAGDTAEDVTVTADVEGETDTGVVYIDNPCQCPPSIDLTANPTSIEIDGVSQLIVYVEESGPVTTGKYVFMSQTSATKRGKLSWTKARLGTVSIKNEQTSAQNDLDGITQCELAMYPKSVASVYKADDDGAAYGSNLYSSHDGKVINLDTELETGTDLLVNYVAQGAALCKFTGTELGTATIKAWITSTLEEGCEASCTVDIEDNTETTDDYPSDYCPTDEEAEEDEGDPGGEDEDYEDATCVTSGISATPTSDELVGRFTTAKAAGCDCETLCAQEIKSNGTTRNYDNASGRTLTTIVTADYGLTEGTDAFDAKYAELKAEAIAECQAQCDSGEQADFNWCVTDSVSGNPDAAALAARFATGLEHDCDCQTLCEAEIDIYGTTQNYDGASGRKVSNIVVQDYGLEEGTPEYWEKYEELKQAAIAECEEECDACGNAETFAINTVDTPSTIAGGSSVEIYVTGGVAPYTFDVSGLGYTIGGVQSYTTDSLSATLSCANGICGTDFAVTADVTITDACGSIISRTLRNTAGTWSQIDTCVQNGGYDGNLFQSIYGKYRDDVYGWCGDPATYGTDTTCCSWTYVAAHCAFCAGGGETGTGTWTSLRATVIRYEWVCL